MMTTKRDRLALRGACYTALIAAAVLCGQRPLAAADAGSPTDICITMTGSNDQVGGLQMDLTWAPGCMEPVRASQGDAAKCASNPSTGKNVQTKVFPSSTTMRAIFFSVSDTNPIPDNSELFCCKFTMSTAQTNGCCSLSIGNLILAGPTGGRLYSTDLPDVSVQALINNAPCTATAPSGSAANPVRPQVPPMAVPPVVSAPGASGGALGGGAAPAPVPPPNYPGGMPPAAGQQAPAAQEEVAPGEAATPVGATPAAVGTRTARTTPAAATATPHARTPQVQSTATAPPPSATAPAGTPTPAAKGKSHKKRRHAS